MTQDEIVRMALEAGYQSVYLSDAPIGRSYQFLERFAALVAERTLTNQKSRYYQNGYEAGQHDEREACAKVCEEMPLPGWKEELVAAIRNRSDAS